MTTIWTLNEGRVVPFLFLGKDRKPIGMCCLGRSGIGVVAALVLTRGILDLLIIGEIMSVLLHILLPVWPVGPLLTSLWVYTRP